MNIKFFDETSLDKFAARAKGSYDEYVAQREDIDEEYEISDWMYKGGTYRGKFDKERRRWVPRMVEGKANVGSLLFHRQVNTLAGMLGAILLSGRDLWKYRDKPVTGNPEAEETGKMTADHLNALTKWCMKQDQWIETKLPEFCTSVFKMSNVFAMITMKSEEHTILVSETQTEETGEIDEYGQPVLDYKRTVKEKKGVIEYPSVCFPYPRNIYADKYISSMRDQECVIVLSTTTKSSLVREGDTLDQEAVAKIDPEKLMWDQSNGAAGKNSDEENAHRDGVKQSEGLMLRWDVLMQSPVKDGQWYEPDKPEDGEAVEHKLIWGVAIGNDLEESVWVKTTDRVSPDGEMPIKEIRALPDDSDMLYHTNLGKLVSPAYAADAALLNAALDNMAVINDPPLEVNEKLCRRVKDFTFKSGQRWDVNGPNAIKPHEVRDSTLQTTALREQVREDVKLALATDQPRLGEYAGARTTKYEVQRVAGSTDQTLALKNSYIVGQLLPWLAKKYVGYCRTYMKAESIQRILGEMMPDQIVSKMDVGEYDVVVDIVTQHEDDQYRSEALGRVMNILSNPIFLQSETHSTDLGELMRFYMEHEKFPARVIGPPNTADSEANARTRIQDMLRTGIYYPPQEGENLVVHLRVARAERLRWRGLERGADNRAQNVQLIDQYVTEVRQIMQAQQQQAQQAAMQMQGGGQMPPEMGGML